MGGWSALPSGFSRCDIACILYRNAIQLVVIISFQHKGLERFFRTGKVSGIQPHHAEKLQFVLGALNEAVDGSQLDLPGWRLHPLKGDLKGYWSIKINGNWRVIFRFRGQDVELLDYLDYH